MVAPTLGVSALFHNAAAAIAIGGEVVAAIEEERVTRRKNDAAWPAGSIEACLAIAGVAPTELAGIAFYERPLRCLARELPGRGRDPESASALSRFRKISRHARELAGTTPVYYFPHHLSHAASAFLTSDFETAAVLVADGVGEDTCTSIWSASRLGLRCLWRDLYPNSFGLVYSYLTEYLGFQPMRDEFKVMGLAAWGEARYVPRVNHIIGFDSQGHARIRPDWLMSVLTGQAHPDGLDEIEFGPRRHAGEPIEQRHKDIAASLQAALTDWLAHLCKTANGLLPGERNLCLAGGVAHNSRAIGELQEIGAFERVFVQPASGDAGGALGAALLPALVSGEWEPRHRAFDPYLGPSYPRQECLDAILAAGRAATEMCDSDLVAHAAAQLASGRIIGWFQGRAEFGPRALGNRSILASPLLPDIGNVLNARIKQRESFRPFAPAVIEECADRYFDGRWIDRFMLVTGRTKAPYVPALRAVTHADGTARVQLVNEATNPIFHNLVRRFGMQTGYPVVLNTSLNHSSEPMALSPRDALRTAQLCGLDGLALGSFFVDLAHG